MLDLGRNSEPITWDIELAQTSGAGPAGSAGDRGKLQSRGVDPSGRHDLTLGSQGTHWPWTLANSLVQARGELTGKIDGEMRQGPLKFIGLMQPSLTWWRSGT